jgi:hypothetical protein
MLLLPVIDRLIPNFEEACTVRTRFAVFQRNEPRFISTLTSINLKSRRNEAITTNNNTKAFDLVRSTLPTLSLRDIEGCPVIGRN